MANTVLTFMYRDGANYKTHNSAVLDGEMDQSQVLRVLACLDEGEFFIPERVGIRASRWNEYNEQFDHVWCTLYEGDMQDVTDQPTDCGITPEELVRRFELMKGRWEEHPLPCDFCKKVPEAEDDI